MKILFTGGSSFTGYWFIRALIEQGHEIVATFQQSFETYSGVRSERVAHIKKLCTTHFVCPTPSAHFQTVIEEEPSWDLWCQHAAAVTNYKSAAFNPLQALQNNCEDLASTLQRLQQHGCQRILLTGSVFEQREGGADNEGACSPYGLSKGLTSDVFAYYLASCGMHFGKFVIPNPFGPFEEPRLTDFLIKNWWKGEVPIVSTPNYVRDNIHVTLLAKAYAQFAGALPKAPGCSIVRPSGYVGTQREFVKRFAREIGSRLQIATPVSFAHQTDFSESLRRVNTDALDLQSLGWKESEAWDDLAEYYALQRTQTH